MSKYFVIIAAALFAVLGGYVTVTSGWNLPPAESRQTGYRGTGMVQIQDQQMAAVLAAANVPPETPYAASADGPRARAQYPGLQVLGDLSEDQFNRLMASMAEWVAPKDGANAGCAYCHNTDNMADRSKYTHQVSVRMIQMTRTINSEWRNHVADTGVTCYTCHRGNPVPQNVWFKAPEHVPGGWMGFRNGQNVASASTARTTLPYDFQETFLTRVSNSPNIRVTGSSVGRPAEAGASINDTEKTHALMNHMSTALGANCTLCHNSRAFNEWDQSPPQRVTAWHGIRMVRALNQNYLDPLGPVFPRERRGPTDDAPKANCATCHNGVQYPLNRVSMLKDYLAELGGRR